MNLVKLAVLAATMGVLTACGSQSGSTASTTVATEAAGAAESKENEESSESAESVAWPTGTVKWVVAANAGGGTDGMARVMTNYLQTATGEAMTVVNDSTGNGTVAYETVRNAAADGATLLFYHSTLPIQYYQGIYDKDPSDPENFTVIANVVNQGNGDVLCVPSDAPYDTLEDLVAYCEANPGTVTFGNQNGGFGQLEALLFEDRAGIDINFVDAGGQADSIVALLGGNIDCTLISLDAALQYEEAGDMKLLGICNEERAKDAPDLPTMKEQGYDVVFKSDMYVFGPANMDSALVESINAVLQGAAEDAEVAESLANFNTGYEAMSVEESRQAWSDVCATIKEMCELAGYDVSSK
ncbi:MAG: tripartite tricarboxylate transporter substrate binding protein [Clostridiales bacterium]|nr:tripartite tricarboxylate transporter substrate binding protein [Clostridiales bacterium]